MEDPKGEAETLSLDLSELKDRWTTGGRDFDCFDVGKKKFFLTGGFSWGDAPCELWNSLHRLCTAGITKACGFDW